MCGCVCLVGGWVGRELVEEGVSLSHYRRLKDMQCHLVHLSSALDLAVEECWSVTIHVNSNGGFKTVTGLL